MRLQKFAALAILPALMTAQAATAETVTTTTETVIVKTEKPVASKTISQQVTQIQDEWAKIKYQVKGKKEQLAQLDALAVKAKTLVDENPTSAEPKIWYAAVLSTEAAIIEGLSALPKVKEAKKLLEAAIAIDGSALKGYGHTSLGALYARVPGWPIAFGDKDKAESHLKKALAIDPASIDANYYYGDFLIRQKNYADAIPVLEKALKANDRPGRKIADDGRRAEIRKLLEEAKENQTKPQRGNYN